jgi:hypothetical protein
MFLWRRPEWPDRVDRCSSQAASQPGPTQRLRSTPVRPVSSRVLNAWSAPLARLAPQNSEHALLHAQHPMLPIFSPAAMTDRMPAGWADRAALYAGESALRISEVVPAKQAVATLAGR